MCIVFPTEDPEQAWEAQDTWLVLAPLENPPNRWFLTYINSFDPKSTSKHGSGDGSGSGLMVFPVPNADGRLGEMDFLLAKTSSSECSDIARTAASAFSEYTDPPPPVPPSPLDLSGLDDDDLSAELAMPTCGVEPPPPPLLSLIHISEPTRPY